MKLTKTSRNMLGALYMEEVISRASQIDPGDEQDWYSMALGWAIAKGLSIAAARKFAGNAINLEI
jgi:hypothetical protein